MSDSATIVRQRFRTYLVRVLGVIVVVPLVGFVLLTLLNGAFGPSDAIGGAIGLAILFGTVGGALAVHRATVRCPACNAWLVPAGVNGLAPRECPSCKASFR